jgi:hypothetical protein
MSAAQIARDQIKDLQQQLLEKVVALKGMQAKINGLAQMSSMHQREKSQLWDQAQTLQVIAIKLGLKPGSAAVGTVPAAVVELIAERDKLLDGYPEGMTPTDARKLKEYNFDLACENDALQAKLDHYAEHATHAARCQLINEIKAAFVPYDKLTAEQVIDLLCAEKAPC